MAAHLLPASADAQLGEIVLAAHQAAAVRRLLALLATHGGALLADDVGLGKTFVALAVARHYAHALVIAPAGLRGMWDAAITRAGVVADVTSYETLSRGAPLPGAYDAGGPHSKSRIAILDEAHHARSTASRRYPRIAALTDGAHTLLLTATPLPNRLGDLRSLVALFAGSRASAMSDEELSAVVYRRTAATVPSVVLPAVARPRWIHIDDDPECLDALLRLPPAVPPAGSGGAGALLTLSLVRQWSSSRAALLAALRRALAKSLALRDAVGAGHMPTAAELRTWDLEGDSMQLAFPELVAAPIDATLDRGSLARLLRAHAAAVTRLLAMLTRLPDPDIERARRIVELQQAHPCEKIVCFTEYAETAAGYWRRLRSRPGVARLTARGGEIASAQISRDEVLQRFAPKGQRVRKPERAAEITTLITTDLLSEGVDLRDATVVVHLDLPWSPARLEQRVGRARRMGSHAPSIAVYAMRPGAPTETVLELERRLREKIAVAARAVGSNAAVLPHTTGPGHRSLAAAISQGAATSQASTTSQAAPAESPSLSDAERRSSLADRVVTWSRTDDMECDARNVPVAAIVAAPVGGWLAAVTVGYGRLLAASLGGQTGSDTALLTGACALAEGSGADVLPPDAGLSHRSLLERAAAEAMRHAAERAAADAVGLVGGRRDEPVPRNQTRPIGAHVLARIHRALVTAPPHQAPRVASLAAAARRVVSGRLSAGMESRLREITRTTADDAAWLAAVGDLASDDSADEPPAFQLHAIIVFVPYLSLSSVSDAELTQ